MLGKLGHFLLAALLLLTSEGVEAKSGSVGGATTNAVQGINVASAVRAPGWNGAGTIGGGTNTTQNLESQHFNESPNSITSAALIYSGWWTTITSGSEAANGNPFTLTASIDYPCGTTFNQETWGGRTSLLMAPGANIQGDYITLTTPIPSGATFCIRTWVSIANSSYSWPSSGSLWGSEVGEIGSALADKTMGGTITGTTATYRPSAVVVPAAGTSFVSLAGIGDSIIAGATDTGLDNHGNQGWLGRSASGHVPYIPMAVTGTTLANQIGNFTYRPNLLKMAGVTHTVIDYGVNDVTGGTTLGNLETQMGTIATAVNNAGAKPVWTTITPRTSSTQNWIDTATQTISTGFTGGAASTRSQFNAYIRTKPAPLFDYVENANTLETAPDSAIWRTNTNGQDVTTSLDAVDSWTVSGTPTTTVFQSNSTRPSSGTSYYASGRVLFTSGVLSGTYATISTYSLTNGQFTVPTLAQAPSAGDTFKAYPVSVRPSGDGLHPSTTVNPNTGVNYGGIPELMNNFAPQLSGWR